MKRDIAIIGIGSRFPEANDLEELSDLLINKKDVVREFSKKRIEDATIDPSEELRKIGFLEDIDKFDHKYFNISLAEAQVMDPHQRILLEVVHEAIDNSGNSVNHFDSSKTAVFVSDLYPEYYKLADELLDTMVAGNSPAFLAARIARQFNLTGNCSIIDTACSSSLVSLHIACNELILGEADQAIVCGANINLFPYKNKGFEFNIWSSDDKSKAFSEEADGMSCGELAACLILKPLDDALRDNDVIHAVIKSTEVNNNANRSASPSAPDSISQASVIEGAWKKANINPEDIGFIEAHGSGTKLGDSLEIEALTKAFKNHTNKKQFVPISTIKSNIGHGLNVSGIAGVIKAVLSLKNKVIYPTIHYKTPNSMIDFENSAVYVNTELKKWEVKEGKKRLAGVTSLGASGTNCHIILEEPPEVRRQDNTTDSYLVTISAKSKEGLKRNIAAVQKRVLLEDNTIDDISYTLNTGRNHYHYRFATVCKSVSDLNEQLLNYLTLENQDDNQNNQIRDIFVFSDYIDFNEEGLYYFKRFESFRETYAMCQKVTEGSSVGLDIFAFQYSLYKFLEDIGVKINNILGVGIGSITTDLINNLITLEDAVKKATAYTFNGIEAIDVRVRKLIERETISGEVCFINMGPDSVLSRALSKRIDDYEYVSVMSICGDTSSQISLLEVLKKLYLIHNLNDLTMYSQLIKGNKIELTGYQFEKIRCWNREKSYILKPDMQESLDKNADMLGVKEENATTIERKVAQTWKYIVEVESFSLDDNFFELGGDSIKATKVIKSLNEEFNIKLDFEDIYDFDSIRALSAYIKELIGTEEVVKTIWKDVLKAEDIKSTDSFFELGGHSLMASQVLNRVKGEFNLNFNFEQLYNHSTFEEFHRFIEQQIVEGTHRFESQEIEKVEEQDYYDVSSTQKRLWILSQIEGSSVAYNTPFTYQLKGKLNKAAFKESIQTIIKRHESLRTVFIPIKDEIKQKIIPYDNFNFIVKEFDYLGLMNVDHIVAEEIQNDIGKPFDLEKGPLINCHLYTLDHDRHVFYFNAHHIINDGWSTHVFLKEMVTIYEALNQNIAYQLEPLKIQFKDYVSWQKNVYASEKYEEDKMYWLSQMEAPLNQLELPADRVRPNVQTYDGDVVRFEFNEELTVGLRNLCKRHNCTMFTTLLAAVNLLFYRYTGERDIVLGTSIAGRQHKDLEDQIGLYINTLSLRTKIEGTEKIDELIKKTNKMLMGAYEHQNYPFEDLVKELDVKRDLSHSPLFDVLVELHNTNFISKGRSYLTDIEMNEYIKNKDTSIFDMNIEFEESHVGIAGSITFNINLFNKKRIERMTSHLISLIDKIVSDDSQSVNEIEYISEEEKRTLLVDFKGKDIDINKNKLVPDYIEEISRLYPDHTAIQCNGDTITYFELDSYANKIAHKLKEKGVKKESIIGIMMDRSIEMIAGILGVWKAGGSYLPIDPNYPEERIEYMIQDSNMILMLVNYETLDSLELSVNKLSISHMTNWSEIPDTSINDYSPEQLAYIIYTSGSTGNPKGVMVDHKGMMNHLYAKINDLDIQYNNIIAQNASQCFDISVWQFFASLLHGGKVFIYKDHFVLDPKEFIDRVEKDKISILEVVPSYLSILLDHLKLEKKRLKQLKYVVVTGETLKPDLVRRWFNLYPSVHLVNAYGPTEASDDITHHHISEYINMDSVPIGKPVQNMTIYILDENMQLCPIGIKGEICVEGIGVGKGYLNNEQATTKAFLPPTFNEQYKLYKTGDIGYWREDGTIEFCGRKDYQVKIRGYRIELEEIERVLQKHHLIKEVIVLELKNDNDESKLGAYIVPDKRISDRSIKEYLKSTLPSYMIPNHIVQLNKLPLTLNGKVDRKALIEMGGAEVENNQNEKPETQLQEDILNIWSKVLKNQCFGISNNFFELGGDSINALKVSIEMKKLGINVGLKELFTHQTIRELSEFIRLNESDVYINLQDIEMVERGTEQIQSETNEIQSLLPEIFTSDEIEEAYPMSDIEIGLLFHTLKNPGSIVHHIQTIFQAKYEEFYTETFLEALKVVSRKHQALRASYNLNDFKVPTKIIHKEAPINLEYIELANQSKEQQEEYIKNFMKRDQKQAFNFERAPLWRLIVFDVGKGNKVFLFVFHQSIMDGWSNATLMTEIMEVYLQLQSEGLIVNVELSSSYKDFVIEQAIEKVKPDSINFWKKELEGYKKFSIVDHFNQYSLPERQSYRYSLGHEILDRLEVVSRKNNVSVKHICFSIYVQILSLISGEEEIVTGILAHNRPVVEDGDKVVGYFLNMVPVRTVVADSMRWKDYIYEIDNKLITLKHYEKMPLSEIMRIIGEKYQGDNPITDTMFNFTDFHISTGMEKVGKQMDSSEHLNLESNIETNTIFDMNIETTFNSLDFKIDSAIFDQKVIDKLVDYFVQVIDKLLVNDEMKLNEIDIAFDFVEAEYKEPEIKFNF